MDGSPQAGGSEAVRRVSRCPDRHFAVRPTTGRDSSPGHPLPRPDQLLIYDADMSNGNPGAFPPAALEWLAPAVPGRVLAIGRPSALTANRLLGLGNHVLLTDKASSAARASRRRYPGLQVVAATPDALPLAPCSIDHVLVVQGMHLLPPAPSLGEFARVLVPGGRLSVLYTVRDDSVPWVRRLATILREYDPEAMTGGEELYSVAAIAASPHFPVVEHRSFRQWVPITREGMLEMVSSAPKLAGLDGATSSRLLDQVGALYDSSARRPEPLLLPYSVMCWRAEVDHSELSSALRPPEDGLQINL